MDAIAMLIVSVISLFITAWIIPSLQITNWVAATFAAVAISVVNAIIRPVFKLLSLPVNVLTLGLFTFIINGLMFWLVTAIVPGFDIGNFWWAILAALVYSIVMTILSTVLGTKNNS